MIETLNEYFTTIYYHLHATHEENISHQSVRILQMIQKEHEVTVRHIANRLNISHNTASEHVKKLEQNSWVKKERATKDQRKVYIRLTIEGQAVVRKHTELDARKLQNAWSHLSDAEQQTVLQAFRLLSEVSR